MSKRPPPVFSPRPHDGGYNGLPLRFPARTLASLEAERGDLGRDILWCDDHQRGYGDDPACDNVAQWRDTYDLLDRAIRRRRELGEE
jgi:hypothetical protein